MYRAILILALGLNLTFVHAEDITLRDGTIYKEAKIVSHDATKVTILHAEGGTTVPIAKLPDDLQKKLGLDPATAAISTPAADQKEDKAAAWNNYRKAQEKYVALDDKLVTKEASGMVTLNVKLNHLAEAKSSTGESLGRGSFVDIFEAGTPSLTDPAEAKPMGSPVFLKNYVLTTNEMTKIQAVKSGATDAGGVYYVVVEPFSFDFWKKAGSPQ